MAGVIKDDSNFYPHCMQNKYVKPFLIDEC